MIKTNNTPSNVGKRVKVTLVGHRYHGQNGTVVSESAKNYRVAIDGVKTPQTLAKPGQPDAACAGYRGRRPKSVK